MVHVPDGRGYHRHGWFKAAETAYDTLGPLSLLLAGSVGYLLWDWIKQPERQGLRSALGDIFTFVMEIELQRSAKQEVFDKALPRVPSRSTLASTNTPESVVGRAALYTLAREMTAHISAHELTETLRTRMSCSEANVRRLLRATPAHRGHRGRWQIGTDQRPRELASGSSRPLLSNNVEPTMPLVRRDTHVAWRASHADTSCLIA